MLAIFLVMDLVVSAVLAAVQLHRSADLVDETISSVAHDDLASAGRTLADARSALASSAELLEHPGIALAQMAPGFAPEIHALKAMTVVAGHGIEATNEIMDAFAAVGADETGIAAAVLRDNGLDLDSIRSLRDGAERALGQLGHAATAIASVESAPLLEPLGRAVEHAARRVESRQELLRSAVAATTLLPDMSGADVPRKYLLAFQSPSEARGGGGLIGMYGILSTIDGRPSLDEVGPIETLGPTVRERVPASRTFAALYGPLGALKDWRQANLSPTFPMTSKVLLDLFEEVRGERLDGVIAMDPLALGQMARGLPDLKVPGWNRTITNNNARRLLLFDLYKRFVHREREQNRYLGALIQEIWRRIATGEVEARGLLRGFVEAATKQHLKIFSVVPEEQQKLESLGVTADPRTVEGPLQLIYTNNNSGNKLDFFLRRKQETEVALATDGSAFVATSIRLHNDLPRRGLRAMSRSGVANDLGPGENRMSVHFMLPRGARIETFGVDGRSQQPFRGRDGGFPVAWHVVTIGPEQTRTVTVTYRLDKAIDASSRSFGFTFWPQATARPDAFRVEVRAPDGAFFRTRAGKLQRVITLSGWLKEPEAIVLRLEPGPLDS